MFRFKLHSGPDEVVVAGALDVVLEDRVDIDVMVVADAVELAAEELRVDDSAVEEPPAPDDVEL